MRTPARTLGPATAQSTEHVAMLDSAKIAATVVGEHAEDETRVASAAFGKHRSGRFNFLRCVAL